MYARKLNLPALIEKESHFLFGPRSTGKTTVLLQQLPQATSKVLRVIWE